eukprot:SAG31_NODE_3765_length_3903_cov_1.945846_3_plen_404_part_00
MQRTNRESITMCRFRAACAAELERRCRTTIHRAWCDLENEDEEVTADVAEEKEALRWLRMACRDEAKPFIPADCEDPLAMLASFAGGWGPLLAGRYCKHRADKIPPPIDMTNADAAAKEFWSGSSSAPSKLWLLWDIVSDEGKLAWSGFFPIASQMGVVCTQLERGNERERWTPEQLNSMLGLAPGTSVHDAMSAGMFFPCAQFSGCENPYFDGFCPNCCFQISVPLSAAGTWKQHVSLLGPHGLTECHISTVDIDLVGIALYPLRDAGQPVFHESVSESHDGLMYRSTDPFVANPGSVTRSRDGAVRGVAQISANAKKGEGEDFFDGPSPDASPFSEGLGENIYPCRADWNMTAFVDVRDAEEPLISVAVQFVMHDAGWRRILTAIAYGEERSESDYSDDNL